MKYSQTKQLSSTKFKRLTGINRKTYRLMVRIVKGKKALHKKSGRPPLINCGRSSFNGSSVLDLCKSSNKVPARDTIHETVKEAVVKDGWEITDDPYVISYGERFLFVDLGASGFIGVRQCKHLFEAQRDAAGRWVGATAAGAVGAGVGLGIGEGMVRRSFIY